MCVFLSQKERSPHVRPWQSDVPHLKESVTSKIQFPSDDEETGLALIGYRGPKATVSVVAVLEIYPATSVIQALGA